MSGQQKKRRRHKTQKPELSARELRFCQLYVEHHNATKSYLDAGYSSPNSNAAGVAAHKLLRNSKIRAYIRSLQDAACEAAKVTVEELARGFKAAVDADVTRLMGSDGEILPPSQWPEEIRRAIVSVEVEELSDRVPDPDNPGRKKKVAVGTKWKIRLENKTECRKVLAQWKRMIGGDAEVAKGGTNPLVIGGADPGKL